MQTITINEEREKGWTRGLGRVRASVQAINRGAWLTSKASLGKPPLSHFTHTPPPLQHPHPPPSSIIYLRVCVVVSGSKIDSKSS
ncbi:hypothetical protein HanIR_Chr15g0767961 [Helianthus annuus]|nr:hypothetical protein HanIR_Chr15g0767961 [Helianthus annuus]